MSRDLPPGAVEFDAVSKIYRLGKPRAFLAAAWPFGTGVGRGETLRALDNVSFSVEPGESFALMGANGAGKSTALKCLAGVTHPTYGHVRHGGRVVALIELGVGFNLDMTGLENARFAATIAGVRGAAAREIVDRAVEFSEIGKFINTPVKRYSSGMYARLCFGIAAHLPADVLIVDEILAVGDLAFQRKCYEHLRQLRTVAGVTLVFVSHNEWVLKETCRRGVLLSHGRVAAEGAINSLLDIYHAANVEAASLSVSATGHRIRILEMDLVPSGERSIPLHGPVEVTAQVEIADDVHQPVVALAIADAQARVVLGTYSDENGVSLTPGRHTVTMRINDLPLPPGPYRFEVFAFERDGSPQGEDALRLDIEVTGDVPNDWEHGLVHVPTRWGVAPPVL